jgi:hypothetical protein
MAKITKMERRTPSSPEFAFFCPGCQCGHWFKTDGEGPCWSWNGDFDKPTVNPSILMEVRGENPQRCHSYVRDGKIRFLNDCTHDKKGQTMEIPDWDDVNSGRGY